MRLFICYPCFEETLTHDPSIGVEVPEKVTPQYTVEVPSGTQIVPRVVGGVGPPFITPELVIALVVVVSAIAIAAFAAKRRGKIVNVVGVKWFPSFILCLQHRNTFRFSQMIGERERGKTVKKRFIQGACWKRTRRTHAKQYKHTRRLRSSSYVF